MRCAIWYQLYNSESVKNTHGVVTFSKVAVFRLQLNFTKSNTSPWAFFAFLRLYEWYQIAQRITYKTIATAG